jgi:DNA-binding MarR family transcriptional regulator
MNKKKPIHSYFETTDFASVCACFNLRKATRVITNLYDEYLRPVELSITQLTLLIALEQAKKISVTRLSKILLMDRTTLARDLKPLERRDLVSIAEGEDRRVRLIALTSLGQKVLTQALPLWKVAQTHIVSHLGDEQFQLLLGQLSDIEKIKRNE